MKNIILFSATLLLTISGQAFGKNTPATLISQQEAIERVKANLNVALYVHPNATMPQARERFGAGGCKVFLLILQNQDVEQLVVSVFFPGGPRAGSGVDFVSPDDFDTPVEMTVSKGATNYSFHRKGIDDDTGRVIKEMGYITISDDGNRVAIRDEHGSGVCVLK